MMLFHAINDAITIKMFCDLTRIKLNVLVSYPFIKGIAYKILKEFRAMVLLVYLDSGAFSKFTGRATHTVYEFAEYVKEYGDQFDGVFNLDEYFDDPLRNFFNQMTLERALGVQTNRKPIIPVVHDQKDPLNEVAIYVDQGHDYVAVGSNLGDKALEGIQQKYPDLKLHMFGNFNRKMLQKYRPYSADSASFIHMARHDLMYYWDDVNSKEYTIRVGKRHKEKLDGGIYDFVSFPDRDRLEKFLENTFGYSHAALLDDEHKIRVANLYFFKQLEDYINAAGTNQVKKNK